MPSLASLASRAGLSPHHFHRIFKAVTGLTPREYAAAHRARRVRAELRRRPTVTEAIYDAGFNSGGRFYATSDEMLGMTPSDYRAGGSHTDIRFAVGECSLGSILVAQSAKGVCAILLGDDPDALVRDLQDRFPRATLIGGDSRFENVVARVVGLVETPAIGLDLPLDVRGTAFQQRVWRALLDDTRWGNRQLRRSCREDRIPEGRAGGGSGLRREPSRGRDSLPSRRET